MCCFILLFLFPKLAYGLGNARHIFSLSSKLGFLTTGTHFGVVTSPFLLVRIIAPGWLTQSRNFEAQFVVEFEKIVDTDNTWRSSA
jgi:hypothetical protein